MLIYRLIIMLCNYPPLKYSQEFHMVTILLLLPSTFAAISLFLHLVKAMTTASIAEAPMDEFYTWTFGPDEIINLFSISFGRMTADFFFCKLLPDPTSGKCTAN
jgi:hypothetical protein